MTPGPSRTRSRWVASVLVLVAGLVAPARAADAPPAPHFAARSVTGEALDLERLCQRGPVLLDFWATWCKPCVAALPELDSLHRRFADQGLTVIGVSVDGPRNFPKVRPFAHRLGLGYPIVLDEDGEIARRYQARVIPTSVLISREGRIVRVTQGWRPGETEALSQAVEALLADTLATPRP